MKNGMVTDEELNELSRRILGAACIVSNTLGSGFKEKVYENVFCHELRKQGLDAQKQVAAQVFYNGVVVGFYL